MPRTLAPTLPPADQNAPNPVAELNARQRQAIASRVAGYERQQVTDAGVDGAATPPKPGTQQPSRKPSASSTNGSPAARSTSPASQTSGSAAPASPAASASTKSSPTSPGAATPASSPPTKGSEPSTADEAEGSAASSSDGSKTPATPAAAPPWSDLKGFKRWAQENPEAALKFREEIDRDTFRMGEDTRNEWIRQTNRSRKMKDELRAQKAEIERVAAEKEAIARGHLERAEQTAGQLRYMTEMWHAFQGKGPNGERVIDFDTADEAFRQNSGGLSFDEYARLRARRGVSNPEAARLRADLRRRELELEQLKTNGAAAAADPKGQGQPAAQAPAAAPAEPAPAATGRHDNPEQFWGDEVPADHPLRQFAGWGKLLDNAMLQFHDDVLDEYSRDAEEIATELVQKKLAALRGPEEPAPVTVPAHTRSRPKTPKNRGQRLVDPGDSAPPVSVPGLGIPADKLVPRGKVNTDRSHREIPKDKWGEVLASDGDMRSRQAWAIERANMRARGIDPDTGERIRD